MNARLLSLFLSALLLPVFAQDSEEMITKSYVMEINIGPFGDVESSFLHRSGEESPEHYKSEVMSEIMMKSFAKDFGVPFPEGSSLTVLPLVGLVSMTNTITNHDIFYARLITGGMTPFTIHIQLRILSFDLEEMDPLERTYPAGIPDEVIIDLWSSGKGEAIASQSVKTLNGVNAIIECVQEVIYPTELGSETEDEEGVTETRGYSDFETRNIGVILNVTPTFSSTGMINLVLLPEQADLVGSSYEEHEELEPVTPLFQSLNVTTQLIAEPGKGIVAGSAKAFDGDAMLYVLVSAQLVGPAGEVLVLPKMEDE